MQFKVNRQVAALVTESF